MKIDFSLTFLSLFTFSFINFNFIVPKLSHLCRWFRFAQLAKGKKFRPYTDKKENKTFLIYKEIQMGSGAKSYMRKGFLIYEEMRKFFPIYEEAVSHI